jgi:hypothetical protein
LIVACSTSFFLFFFLRFLQLPDYEWSPRSTAAAASASSAACGGGMPSVYEATTQVPAVPAIAMWPARPPRRYTARGSARTARSGTAPPVVRRPEHRRRSAARSRRAAPTGPREDGLGGVVVVFFFVFLFFFFFLTIFSFCMCLSALSKSFGLFAEPFHNLLILIIVIFYIKNKHDAPPHLRHAGVVVIVGI